MQRIWHCRAANDSAEPQVIVVGAGHNGLVAATLLARQGLKVKVLEEKAMVGGACKTERPFGKAPGLAQSTGAYLLGLMPPELIDILGIEIPHMRRDPHYFLPTMSKSRYLLFGSNAAATKHQFQRFFSEQDWEAHARLAAELAALRDDLAPAWLQEALPLEETAERYVRPALRETFVSLCRGSVLSYLERFGFRSDLVKTMYALDGIIGSAAGLDTPGSGHNFLVHNMCRLPAADGTWMVVEGGMGTVTQRLKEAALSAGAAVLTEQSVTSIIVEGRQARGVVTADGQEHRALAVVANCDPFRMRQLAGQHNFPADFNTWLDGVQRSGTTMKVNLALKQLPRFSCLLEERGQHRATIHLLPDEGVVLEQLRHAHAEAMAGRLPANPAIDMYTQTAVDPTLTDAEGRVSAALFVQWVPYTLASSTWDKEEERYTQHLIGILDRFAPGAADLVVDTFTLTPPKIESHFGISFGHIFHVDNMFGFNERFPTQTPIQGLYSASAGCHPAGSVIGCAGHNAAARVIKDLGFKQWWSVPR